MPRKRLSYIPNRDPYDRSRSRQGFYGKSLGLPHLFDAPPPSLSSSAARPG